MDVLSNIEPIVRPKKKKGKPKQTPISVTYKGELVSLSISQPSKVNSAARTVYVIRADSSMHL